MTSKRRISSITDKLWILIPFVLIFLFAGFAGPIADNDRALADDTEDVNEVIDNFEIAYSNERLDDLRQLFFAEAVIAIDTSAGDIQRVYGLENWLSNTQEYTFARNEFISDELTNREIQVFRNIAYVVCDYRYEDDNNVGIGVDVFTMMKMRDRWRILSLQFTGDEGPGR